MKLFRPIYSLIFMGLLLLCNTALKAQGFRIAFSSNVPKELTICGLQESFSVNIFNPSPDTLKNILLSISMPPGIRYTANSVTGAVESNITDLSSPLFAVNDLPSLTNILVTFSATAGCDIMPFLAAGNPVLNEVRADYIALGNANFDTHTTTTYLIKQPNLSIINVSNQSFSGNIGDSFQRCITITNGGLGALRNFVLTDVHGNGILVNSISAGSLISSNNVETISFSGIDFANIGNGNNLFETGEQIIVCENVSILNCVAVESQFSAAWGCNNQVCQSSTSSANIVFPNLTPNLSVTHQPSQSVCYGMNVPNQQQLTIVNNGLGQATNVAINVFQSTGSGFVNSLTSALDENSFTIQVGTAPPIPISVTVNALNINYPCLNGLRAGNITANLPPINSGETLILRWNSFSCCTDICPPANNVSGTSNGWSYEGTYSNICQKSFVIPGVYARAYNQLFATLSDNASPSSIVSGQTLTYSFLFANDTRNYASDGTRQWRYKVTLPPCLQYAGNARIINRNGTAIWNPVTVNATGNIVNFIFNSAGSFDRTNAELVFDLTANCLGACVGGADNILLESFYSTSLSCACEHAMSCVNLPINIVCPSQCIGMNFNNFSMLRTSYGQRDDNNDGVPEPGPVSLNLIKSNRAMYGDTITATYQGTILGGNFPFMYAATSFTNGNYHTFLDAQLVINRAGNTFTIPIVNPVVSNPGTIRIFDFDLSSNVLIANGGVPPNFVFQDGDEITFSPRFQITRNTGGAVIQTSVTNEFYTSNIANPVNTADKLWCNEFRGAYLIVGYYYTTWGPDFFSSAECNTITISQNYYLSIGPCCSQYSGGNMFPFEYRRWAWPQTLTVTAPQGYQYVSARFNHTRTAGSGVSATTAWQSLTPTNANGSVFEFQTEQYFSQFGGTFLESDDGFFGTLQVELQPTCGVIQDVQSPMIYDWIYGQSPQLQPSPTANQNVVSTHDFITYRGPDLFLQSALPSITASDSTAVWDISISNVNSVAANNVFIAAPQISGVSVIEVFDVTNNSIVPASPGGIYQLGIIAGASNRELKISAHFSSCFTDSVIVHVGWNCVSYPADLANYPCATDKIKLSLTPQIPTLIANITSPPSTIQLCDTASYLVEGVNIQLGTAYLLTLRIVLPLGVIIMPGTAELSYPNGAAFTAIPDPNFIGGTIYEWDVSTLNNTLLADGLKGILQTNLNSVKVRFKVRTNCNYVSGSLIGFNFKGQSACGFQTGQEITLSSQLAITGADKPYETRVDLISTFISPCEDNTLMAVNILNKGPLSTALTDSVVIILPEGVTLVNNSFAGIINAPLPNEFSSFMLNNQQHLSWRLPPNIQAGDSIRFSFRFVADASFLSCNIQNVRAFTLSNKNLLCQLSGVTCGVGVNTGDTLLPMFVFKGDLNLQNLSAFALNNGIMGEELHVNLDIQNVGQNIVAGNNNVLSFYFDADGNGVFSAGDNLLFRDTILAALPNSSVFNYNAVFNVPPGNACNLLAVFNVNENFCFCNTKQAFLDNIRLLNAGPDGSACSSESILIGLPDNISGYVYSWSPANDLLNANIAQTNYTLPNMSPNNLVTEFVLTTNRINCSSADTMIATIYPLTPVSFSGLATNYCDNNAEVQLIPSPIGGVFSGNGMQQDLFFPRLAQAGNHTIIYTFTDANNCMNADTQQTIVFASPLVSFSGLDPEYCELAPTATLIGNPLNGIFSGAGIANNVFSPVNAGVGLHNIIYVFTDINNCSNVDTQRVLIRAMPIVNFTGLNLQYCTNEADAVLVPNISGGTFTGGGIINANRFRPSTAGVGSHLITYSYTDRFQCSDTFSQPVVVFAYPTVSLSGLAQNYCIDQPVVVMQGSPPNGLYTGNGVNGNEFNAATAMAGAHLITYQFTDNNNCTATDSQLVFIHDLPIVNFSGLAPSYCMDAGVVSLNGNQAGGIFSGSGMRGNNFLPAIAGSGAHEIIYSFTDANTCFNADTQQTIVNDLPIVNFLGLRSTYCADDSATILTPQPPGGLFSGSGINGFVFNPANSNIGLNRIQYSFSDTNNCKAEIAQFTTVNALPEAEPLVSHVTCKGLQNGSIQLNQIAGTSPFTYSWNGVLSGNSFQANIGPGTYDLTIADNNDCEYSNSYIILEPDSLLAQVTTSDAICFGDENGVAEITVEGGTLPYRFEWNNGLNTNESDQLIAGNYSVTITDNQSCKFELSFAIQEPAVFLAEIVPPFDSIAFGNTSTLLLNVSTDNLPVNIEWSPTEGLSCLDCINPIASPLETTIYTASLTDASGCFTSAQAVIVVKDKKIFFVPNIFTPNGDGQNDIFHPQIRGVKKYSLLIYNRWGEKVFETQDVNEGWDGTFKGKLLGTGTFIYHLIVVFKDNVVKEHKGSVQLAR